MAVQAPMPRASVSTATIENPGFLVNCLRAKRTSCIFVSWWWSKNQTPESKHQTPSSKHQKSSKSQAPIRRHRCGIWDLELGIFLQPGVWDLVFSFRCLLFRPPATSEYARRHIGSKALDPES